MERIDKVTFSTPKTDDVVMGRAYVHNERQKLLTDYDLQIVVNKRVWELANATQREALVAHELCHFEPKEDEDLEGESA